MKRITLLLMLVTATTVVSAQETQLTGTKVGISFLGLGSNDAIHLTSLDGAASYFGRGYYGIQFDYIRPLNKVFSLEAGMGFRHHDFTIHSNVPPNVDNGGREFSTNLLTIPIGLRVNFLKYAFINSGILLTTPLSSSDEIADQKGIGFNLGVGLQYDFNSGLGIHVNPFMAMHSTISLSSESYPERVLENGLKMGVTYRIR